MYEFHSFQFAILPRLSNLAQLLWNEIISHFGITANVIRISLKIQGTDPHTHTNTQTHNCICQSIPRNMS